MVAFRKSFVVVAAIAAGLAIMSPASAAEYPEPPVISIELDVQACAVGGTDVRIRAEAQAGEEELTGTMTIEAFGDTFTEEGSQLTVNAESPVVTQRENFTIRATFVPDDSSFETATTTETITLAPRSDGCEDDGDDDSGGDDNGSDGGLLPDTGGTTFWLIVLAAILLAAGASVLEVQRRRRKNAG